MKRPIGGIRVVVVMAAIAITTTPTATAEVREGPSLASQTAKAIVATWKCQWELGLPRAKPAESPWSMGHHSYGYRQMVLLKWLKLRTACIQVQRELIREWNWRAWLPDKWRRVGICETGLNWRHANGRYVSAFGISRVEYDRDAAYMGARPWNDAYPPSPWNQYQAAVGHYKRFGGFSGWGCRGA